MKKLMLLLTLLASVTFGQQSEPKKLAGDEAKRLSEITTTQPAIKTQSIPNAGIIEILGVNGGSSSFIFTLAKGGGEYLFKGTHCDGETMGLGTYQFYDTGYQTSLGIVDLDMLTRAAQGITPMCRITAYRLSGSYTEQLSVELGQNPRSQNFKIAGEGINDRGEYYLYLSGLAEKPFIIIGTYFVSTRVEQTLQGWSAVYFSNEVLAGTMGPTTVTVCQKGSCETQLFDRRITPVQNNRP